MAMTDKETRWPSGHGGCAADGQGMRDSKTASSMGRAPNSLMEKYQAALRELRTPGGTHARLLGVANLARLAGRDMDTARAEMLDALGGGSRAREHLHCVESALAKAWGEIGERSRADGQWKAKATPRPKAEQPSFNQAFIDYVLAADGCGEAELWEESPVRIDWEPGWQDAAVFLLMHYRPGEYLFLGDTMEEKGVLGVNVRERDDWIKRLEYLGTRGWALPTRICLNPVFPYPVPNPLQGGAPFMRCNASIATFRFLMVEHDAAGEAFPDRMEAARLEAEEEARWKHLPADKRERLLKDTAARVKTEIQAEFWWGWMKRHGNGNVAALIHTGNKSIHAVLYAPAANLAAYKRTVGNKADPGGAGLFGKVFWPMGFDHQTPSPSFLARLPGAQREPADGNPADSPRPFHRLLFLNRSFT